MSRLFFGNFAFEDGIDPGRNATRQVIRLEAELACIWLAVADDGDLIFTRSKLPESFWDEMQRFGLPKVIPVTAEQLPNFHPDEIVPWGWTPQVLRLASSLRLPIVAPEQDVIWNANSRRSAFLHCQANNQLLPGESIAATTQEALAAISRILDSSSEWLVKPVQGQSGRGHLRGKDLPTEKELSTLQRLLERQKYLHIEPVLEVEMELGSQWEIPQQGEPRILGITQLFSDPRGGYSGTKVPPEAKFEPFRQQLIREQENFARELQRSLYFGPVGIDAMIFKSQNGLILRSIQDVNARWTMGRIAWEWSQRLQRLNPTKSPGGTWLHAHDQPRADAIPLSPKLIDQIEVRRRTWWAPSLEWS
ncbi:hypothetical protein SH668x_001793 [Planctomicrobium sp. SH668]|uniref:hypothetical protein n=1 Tax=Planctomicrobium sp. SH668 TaxID=3448126 RepID=UPI003F5BB611